MSDSPGATDQFAALEARRYSEIKNLGPGLSMDLVNALMAEIAELRKDRARLDWLEVSEVHMRTHREQAEDGWTIWRTLVHRHGKSIGHPQGNVRAAIDAAMEAK